MHIGIGHRLMKLLPQSINLFLVRKVNNMLCNLCSAIYQNCGTHLLTSFKNILPAGADVVGSNENGLGMEVHETVLVLW